MSRPLSKPVLGRMPADLRAAAVAVAERMGAAGQRAWLVGGAVRDLALGIDPHDVDLASAARPEEVEELFDRTLEVGKQFGTILVHVNGVEVQVTTFRTDGDYSDSRRPDAVAYGTSLEEDAARRDFTCNAIYLDPLTDEIRDPEGGFADLASGVLRCVGDPGRRFGEDGLRLLRMARFAAGYGLEVDAATRAAARENTAALDGVSRERIRAELEGLASGEHAGVGLALLAETGIWERFLPAPKGGFEATLGAVEGLGPRPGLARLVGVLLYPGDPQALAQLRPSRELERRVLGLWRLGEVLAELLERGADVARSEKVRLVRDPQWAQGAELFALCSPRAAELSGGLRELQEFERSLGEAGKHPAPFLTSADLGAAGVAPGPLFGELLRRAEDLQLDGAHGSREQALAWLQAQVQS